MDATLFKISEIINKIHELGPMLAENGVKADIDATFVFENYEVFKELKLFSAVIPQELGGMGIKHSEMCQIICAIAEYCGSIALAFSMNQHLVAALVWKYLHGKMEKKFLKK